ncbi:MAG: hypothetical protein EBT42_04025 [Actinobacteria bacterium]|nr:hypothetical protein [Actinomycetota bacterium]
MSQSIRERRAESLGRSIRIKQSKGKALSKRKIRANDKHRKQVAQISHRNGAVVTKGFDVFTKDLKAGTVQKRTSFMFSIVALLLVGLGVRVAMLQTVWSSEYRDASVSQRTRVQTLRAERGSILDRNGQELAFPIPTRTVFADPRSVTDPIGVANAVGGILQMTDEAKLELSIKLRDQSSNFVYVARQTDQRLADVIVALGLKGVSSYRESGRALTSSGLRGLIGRTDIDGLGISGLELQYQELLAGQDGRIAREVNASGKSMAAGSSSISS